MTVKEGLQFLKLSLSPRNGDGEAGTLAEWTIEYLTGLRNPARSFSENTPLTTDQEQLLHAILERLLKDEPIQYVLREAWFCGLKFFVNQHVLIPRPETEELVEWVISHCKFPVDQLSILDVGTGSGCIPVSLKRRLRKAVVTGLDISPDAIEVAIRNADELGVEVNFITADFLNKESWSLLPGTDILVSNPPYIPEKNKSGMAANVLNYEPSLALFVRDDDPLLFYRALAEAGRKLLNPNGYIFVEIHFDKAAEIKALFEKLGYETEVKKDIQGNDRMVKAWMKD